ncbi:MAG: hypothetical protein MJY71_06945 [Bacteroidaceae bacterium]|nr:hypothetical protein [Bacteroidaceae bacterium]
MPINNKLIAKNTISLYARTFIVLLISLYLSRKILEILGEVDLGIYNVVGGIVTLIAFFINAQTTATSRFITYELGKKSGNPSKIFSECITIHILLAAAIIFLGETFGLFVVYKFTNIPPERFNAALFVYHFSILTLALRFLIIPVKSVVIAHEKMKSYATISIAEIVLKLVLVLLIGYASIDHLKLYGLALFLITGIILVVFVVYVSHTFKGYSFWWKWDKDDCLKIVSFSGWTLLGSSANTATQQGVSLLFNNFVGLVANTALGFANQVNGAVCMFVSSFATAFHPQIVKTYAANNFQDMHTLMCRASKVSFFLAYVLALPLLVNMDYVLEIWLGNVPKYTVEFCSLIVICSVIDATTGVFNTAITASGKIKGYQIAISISFTLDLVCAFLLLECGLYPALVFGSRILTRGILNMLIGMYYSKKNIHFKLLYYIRYDVLPIIVTIFLTGLPLFALNGIFDGTEKLFITIGISTVLCVLCLLFVLLDKAERKNVISLIVSYGKRKLRV